MKQLLFFILIPLVGFIPQPWQSSGFIEDFKLPNVVDSQEFSLREYEAVPTVVVIFTSLYCPYAQLYEERIRNLIRDFQGENIRFILVNSNSPKTSPKESKENMAQMAQEKQVSVPFLADHNQRVARLFGAEKSPEVFVLSRQKNSFKIVYQGAIDDNPQVPNDVHHQYLHDFLKASGSGKTYSLRTTPATGCMIKR